MKLYIFDPGRRNGRRHHFDLEHILAISVEYTKDVFDEGHPLHGNEMHNWNLGIVMAFRDEQLRLSYRCLTKIGEPHDGKIDDLLRAWGER